MYQVSDSTKQDILVNLIEPSYRNDIKSNLRLKKVFKKMGLTFESLSKFFVGIASVTSFASGIYKYEILAFLAGTASVVSLVLLQYSSYSYRESKKINAEVNTLLTSLNITNIIDTTASDNSSDRGTLEPGSPTKK
jgi:hypothetical protein